MSDPFGSFEKPNPYGEAPFAGQPRPPYGQTQPFGPPQPGFGQQPPHGQQQPHAYRSYGAPAPRDPNRRPGTVLAAGIVAIVSSGIVAVLSVVMIIGLIVARAEFADEFRDEDGSLRDSDGVITVLVVVGVVAVLMCAAAIVCAALMLRRSNAARIVLVVLSGVTIAISLVSITSVFPILTVGAAVTTIVLAFVGGANEWFRPPPVVAPHAPYGLS